MSFSFDSSQICLIFFFYPFQLITYLFTHSNLVITSFVVSNNLRYVRSRCSAHLLWSVLVFDQLIIMSRDNFSIRGKR